MPASSMSHTVLTCLATVSPGRPRMISVKDPVPVLLARVDILTMASRLMFDRLMSRSTSGSVDWTEAPTCSASPSTRAISTMRSF